MSVHAPLILLGGGGHAAVVAESARAAGWRFMGYLDDSDHGGQNQAQCLGLERCGTIADLSKFASSGTAYCVVHAAVGDGRLRRAWLAAASELGLDAPAIIHPSAVVSPSATLGRGVFVGPRAVINARTKIGDGVIVNSGAIVEHDCDIGPYSHIAPGAVLGGGVVVGKMVLIGIGSTVIPNVRIGSSVIVGAAAAVVGEVPEGVTVTGVPAGVKRGAARSGRAGRAKSGAHPAD